MVSEDGEPEENGQCGISLMGCVQMAPMSFRSNQGPCPYPTAYLYWKQTPGASFSSLPTVGGLTLPCGKGNGGFQELAVFFFSFYVYGYFVCMYICALHVCLVPMEATMALVLDDY